MELMRFWHFSLVCFLTAAFVSAQEPILPEQPVVPVETTVPAETAPAVDDDSLREQTIYVPYNKLREVFEKEGRGVFLPYEEFQKLWKQARESLTPETDEASPVNALITQIESKADVGDEVVAITATLSIEVLQEGWHEIPLRLADAAILSAQLGGEPARILSKGDAGYALLVRSQGDQPEELQLTLKYTKAFSKSPGRNSISFQSPQAPVNRWQIRIPQSGVKVNVSPMIAASEQPPEPPAAEDEAGEDAAPTEETVVLAFVGAAPTVQIDWTPKAEGATGLAALAAVKAHQQVTLDEGVLRTRTDLNYEISRAELSVLSIETPADHRVLNVADANVKEWTVESDGDVNRINVQLYEPASKTQAVSVELEKFSSDMLTDDVPVPVVKALNVGRQQGVVVVRVAPSLRAEVAGRSGLLQLDAGELPPELAGGKWDFSFRYATLPFALSLGVEKVQPRIETLELVEAYIQPDRFTLNLLALYDIQRAGVFQLELDVPAGFEVRPVRGYAAADAQAASVESQQLLGEDKTRLVVNLSRKAIGKVGLLVEMFRRMDDPNLLEPTGETTTLPLPLPRVAAEGVEQATGRLVVYAPESLRVNPSTQQGVQSISAAEALEGTASTREGRFGDARSVLFFAYTRDPVDLQVKIERLKPQITVKQLLIARIKPGDVDYEATFYYSIRYSSVKSLRLDVPQALASEIRNQTPAVARDETLDPQPDDVPDGYEAWSLTGETEFLGDVTVKFHWNRKIDGLDIGKSTALDLPWLQPQGVDQASGQIVLTKAEMLDLHAGEEAKGLLPIDPQHDLWNAVQVEDAARAFEFYEAWKLPIEVTRYKLEDVKRTSVERAVIRMEVTRSDQVSVQALYRMRSARQRLAVDLPAGAEFDTAPLRINGQSVSLGDQGQGQYYIPLTSQDVDAPFLVELRFTMPGDYRRLDLPSFPDNPAVQKVDLCVYLPRELALLGSRGPWTSEMQRPWYELLSGLPQPVADDRQLIEQLIDGLGIKNPTDEFATDGRLYVYSTLRPAPPPDGSLRLWAVDKLFMNSVTVILLALVGLALLRSSFSVKCVAVVFLLALVLLAGVFSPVLSRQILNGATLVAVLVVIGIWLAYYVLLGWPKFLAWASRPRPRREAAAQTDTAAEGDAANSDAANGESENGESADAPKTEEIGYCDESESAESETDGEQGGDSDE